MFDPVGVWGGEQMFGPDLRGDLTLRREGAHWRAWLAGAEARAPDESPLFFDFGAGRGALRAPAPPGAAPLVGHWVQPPGPLRGNAYATPVALRATGAGAWRGVVAPLDERLRLYLVVARGPDGGLTAFIRDPEQNLGAQTPFTGASQERGGLRLTGRDGAKYLAAYDAAGDALRLTLPGAPAPLVLTRRGADAAPGFYTHIPPAARYTYRQPAAAGDGWPVCSLAEAGLAPEPLIALVERILQSPTDRLSAPYVQGLLIARHGRLALEEYFYGYDRDETHDLRSASKSLAAPLLGLAMDQGAPIEVSAPIYSLFPEYVSFAQDEPRKRAITVEHLLTMTAGYACDDDDEESPGAEDVMQGQAAQPDWYKYTLDLPMARAPGAQAAYCSAGMHLVGGAIARATGAWLPDFFGARLAEPLSFGRYHLQLTPRHDLYLGGGSYMRPRDFLKLGQLMLAGGRWNGRQILSRAWVARTLEPHASLHAPDDYGYGWHRATYESGGRGYTAFQAAGNGGQLLIVIPDLDLAMMITAANYGDYGAWRVFRDEWPPEFVIPAARA
jgi:CubicO group peptidase (beta-lactamase class C family)